MTRGLGVVKLHTAHKVWVKCGDADVGTGKMSGAGGYPGVKTPILT